MDTSVRKTIDQLVVELPDSVNDLAAARKLKQSFLSLNDQIEAVHLRLWGVPEYKRYLAAIYDEQAVEGSCAADNLKAAEMVRDAAKKSENYDLGSEKLATIVKSLKVVKRRYGISRKERRETLGGEHVPAERNSSNSE